MTERQKEIIAEQKRELARLELARLEAEEAGWSKPQTFTYYGASFISIHELALGTEVLAFGTKFEIKWRVIPETQIDKNSKDSILLDFRSLFAAGKEEVFRDGVETAFSRGLIARIEKFGNIAIIILTDLIVGEQVHPEVAGEALRWIGRIDNPPTYNDRRQLLEYSLSSPSPTIRDGALLGLASLDDPVSIPVLEKAVEQERIKELRQDMQQALKQLTETRLENARGDANDQ